MTTIVNPNPSWTTSSCNPAGGFVVDNIDVVDVCAAAVVMIRGVTISGNFTNPNTVGGCNHGVFGVAVMGGAALTLRDSVVTGAQPGATLFGCQTGIGVVAGNATTNQKGIVTLKDDTVNDYAKGGVYALNVGSKANVIRTTVTGAGPTALVAQNGVEIGRGASGKVLWSTISGNECDHATCGPDYVTQDASFGVLVFDPGDRVGIRYNTITDNDGGVFSCGASCLGYTSLTPASVVSVKHNTISNNRYYGVAFDQGPSIAAANTISGGNQGIVVAATSSQTAPAHAVIRWNTISGVADADIEVVTNGPTHPWVPYVNAHDNYLLDATAILNQTTDQLRAPGNWYGDPSGPSDWSFGSGGSVSENVGFFPWATSPIVSITRLLPRRSCDHLGSGTYADSSPAVLCGTMLNNTVVETGSADTLYIGRGGHDNFTGGSGASYVMANPGSDVLTGGPGPNDHAQCGGPGDTHTAFEYESNC